MASNDPRWYARLALVVPLAVVLAGPAAVAAPEPDASPAARDPRFGIAEAHKNAASKSLPIGFERITVPWNQVQPDGPDDFRADLTFRPQQLQAELDSGVQVIGLLQFTPAWAALNPADGTRSVPKNLDQPWDAPDNYWGQFVRKIVQHYAGRIDAWVIWNEPEIQPTDLGATTAISWAGGPAEYVQLLKVAYLNAKAANPNATVVFAGTAYWLDKNAGRQQFFQRSLDALLADPSAPAHGWYFDAAAFNIYRAADDVYRIADEMRRVMRDHGLAKPLWLTETNAMPFDPAVPCADRFRTNPLNVTMDEQAAFVVQAFALGLAAGWERVEFYQMTDSNTCEASAIWGLARDDGSLRPAFTALQVVAQALAGAQHVRFVPYLRDTQPWGIPSPDDPGSYYPDWQVYQVVADKGDQRVSVLWNGDGQPLRARVLKVGNAATLIDRLGNQRPIVDTGGWYVVDLGPATARGPFDPDGYYYIGGDPLIIVQSGVPPDARPAAPDLGEPGAHARGFRAFVIPENGLPAAPGQTLQFKIRLRGSEGFTDPVAVEFQSYSTQRDPAPKPALPATLGLLVPDTIYPDDAVTALVEVHPGIAPGIHFVTLRLHSGEQTQTVDLALLVQ